MEKIKSPLAFLSIDVKRDLIGCFTINHPIAVNITNNSTSEKIAYMYTLKIMFDTSVMQDASEMYISV
jgi:hypothetical protein